MGRKNNQYHVIVFSTNQTTNHQATTSSAKPASVCCTVQVKLSGKEHMNLLSIEYLVLGLMKKYTELNDAR